MNDVAAETVEVAQESIEDKIFVLDTTLHQINHDDEEIYSVEITADNEDLNVYLRNILNDIEGQQQKRSYGFQGTSTAFRFALREFSSSNVLGYPAEDLAHRLRIKESGAEESYGHLAKKGHKLVKRGSFLQFIFKKNDSLTYLGVKIEHKSYLDDTDFRMKTGLPDGASIYKACRVDFSKCSDVLSVYIFDTNQKPSKYWWDGFLELRQLVGDEENTVKAVNAVVGLLNAKLQTRYPSDHTLIKNHVVAEFKKTGEMRYFDFIDEFFPKYNPIDPSLKEEMPSIIDKLKRLPEHKTKGFETHFKLYPESVPFKRVNLRLNQHMKLSYDEGIPNISDLIWSEETREGKKLVVINSPEAFDNFVRKPRA